MARAIWKGSLRFGLVEIQVGLYPAERSNELSFTFLDRKDLSPVGYERINKDTGRKVPWERIVRGFKHSSGRYVVVTEDDLKHANVEATQSVDILAFVPADAIEPMFYDKPYYLLPTGRNAKSYVLLRESLRRSSRVGVGRVVIRTRQHLAAVFVRDDLIVLDLLRYPQELLSPQEIKSSSQGLKSEVDPKELKMAARLIEGMSEDWAPESYKDDYRDDVLALIEKKVKAGEFTKTWKQASKAERSARKTNVVDLMPLLRQSLEAAQAAPRASSARTSKRKPMAARRRVAARTRHRSVRRSTRHAS